MKRRPLLIQVITLGYLLSPFFFLFQYFYFSQASLTHLKTWETLYTPYKLSFLLIPPLVAYGIWKIHIWGWYLAVLHLCFLIGNNVLAYLVGSRTPGWAIIVFSVVTLVIMLTFVRRTIRAPYFNPRIRWWEVKPRYAITLGLSLKNDRAEIEGETYNISEGGLFMVSKNEVSIDEEFQMILKRNGAEAIQTRGRVVWVNLAGQKLPQGFGMVFSSLDKMALREIRRYLKDQKSALKQEDSAASPETLQQERA